MREINENSWLSKPPLNATSFEIVHAILRLLVQATGAEQGRVRCPQNGFNVLSFAGIMGSRLHCMYFAHINNARAMLQRLKAQQRRNSSCSKARNRSVLETTHDACHLGRFSLLPTRSQTAVWLQISRMTTRPSSWVIHAIFFEIFYAPRRLDLLVGERK